MNSVLIVRQTPSATTVSSVQERGLGRREVSHRMLIAHQSGAFTIMAGQRGSEGKQGVPGPAGGAVLQKIAAQALSGHRIVYSTDADRVDYATADILPQFSQVLGLTLGAAGANQQINVQNSGEVELSGWSWVNGPVLLGLNGQLTQSLPAGAVFSLPIGFATSPVSIFLKIGTPILLE